MKCYLTLSYVTILSGIFYFYSSESAAVDKIAVENDCEICQNPLGRVGNL